MDKWYPWCSESMKITHREGDDLCAVRRKETPLGGGGEDCVLYLVLQWKREWVWTNFICHQRLAKKEVRGKHLHTAELGLGHGKKKRVWMWAFVSKSSSVLFQNNGDVIMAVDEYDDDSLMRSYRPYDPEKQACSHLLNFGFELPFLR